MKWLIYFLYYIFLLPFSKLPFSILYRISDGLYFLIFYIIKYRKKIVFENLKNAFPEKSDKERLEIARQFYRNFSDLIVETLKIFSFTKKDAKERCGFLNPELPNYLYQKHPVVIALAGHLGNWEMAAISIGNFVDWMPVISYKPFTNENTDKLMVKLRGNWVSIIPYYNTETSIAQSVTDGYFMYEGKQQTKKPGFVFLSDQAPSVKNSNFWTTFLHQETAFYTKIEHYARKYNLPVMYCETVRLKRGYFAVEATLITEHAAETQPTEITKKYVECLENSIQKNPSSWLWTHRRWKRNKTQTLQEAEQNS